MTSKTNQEPKTKKEIEAEEPFIHPKDCPGAIIAWITKRDKENLETWRNMMREELKPIRRFMRMAVTNRIWLVILSAVVLVIAFILIYHLVNQTL